MPHGFLEVRLRFPKFDFQSSSPEECMSSDPERSSSHEAIAKPFRGPDASAASDPQIASTRDFVPRAEDVGTRLDQFLVRQFPEHSRMQVRKLINAACVTVDGKASKCSHHLRGGELIRVRLPELPREIPPAENIPLEVLYEDEWLIAVNKPSGMVVHPAKGHWAGTLVSALQFHFNQLSTIGGVSRPGIVHRIDRDTTGVLVVAKDDRSHMLLTEQFRNRKLEKEYFAIVTGRLDRDRDWIRAPIGMHPYVREKMAIRYDHPSSRESETFYEVSERFAGYASVRVFPKTGRTHQIRVHFEHLGCPLLCDKHYSGQGKISRHDLDRASTDVTPLLARQALHARRLSLLHPHTREPLTFEAPLPADLEEILRALRQARPAS